MSYRVVVSDRPPFAFKSTDPSRHGNDVWYGYLIELLPVVLQYAGLDYNVTYYESPMNSGGLLAANGSWSGVIGEVVSGKADIAAFPLSVSAGRPQVIDMTYSFYDAGIGMLVLKEIASTRSFFFLRPFEWSLWLALLATVFFVAILLWLLQCVSPFGSYEVKRLRTADGHQPTTKYVLNAEGESYLMDSWMSVVLNPPLPRGRSWAIRLLSLAFAFFCLITMSSYTANLASYLTVQKFSTPISSLQDLVTSGLPFGLNANGATQAYFAQTLDPLAQTLAPRQILQGTTQDGVQAVRDQKVGAYMTDAATLQYYAQQQPCDLELVGDPFGPSNYAFGLTKNSSLTSLFNNAILVLRGKGVIDELQRKWMRDLSQCTTDQQVSNQALTITDFSTLWWYLFVFAGVAFLYAVGERLLVYFADKYPGLRGYVKRMGKFPDKWHDHKRFALSKRFSFNPRLRRNSRSLKRTSSGISSVPTIHEHGKGGKTEDQVLQELERGVAVRRPSLPDHSPTWRSMTRAAESAGGGLSPSHPELEPNHAVVAMSQKSRA